ncbi:glycogen synthase [Actinomycetaceae bacterium WB03_NA08]|uniref:Glycogen synthase n=1 Tax=Scrofimicrobium canadense TaxID=2652290 RepID=A0A6N7VP58_9ACTO|nr:glycogen synthase [Scrofimicrobium canadense]MSS83514.1 glycogen synthase [Scrofimicrobium canadense]
MRVDLMTREYTPYVYGGAGVHVVELAKVLRKLVDLRVRAFDGPRNPGEAGGDPGVVGYSVPAEITGANPAVETLSVDLQMACGAQGADIVHSHTWYTNFAGLLAKQLYGIPLVISAHSLEPLRPWKAEQLGGGYEVSSFVERSAYEAADAIVAVSHGMREDILRCYPGVSPSNVYVIHNGIDLDEWKRPTGVEAERARVLAVDFGIDPDVPTVIFVGRITRQKGLPYFLRAAEMLPEGTQVVLCAGAPDTPEIEWEVEGLVARLQQVRGGVVHISQMLPHNDLVALLSIADVFVTPSVYEPLGIVNLEAMALELPVVGTKTGGIPDVVHDGVNGYLVPIEQLDDGTGTPVNPQQFERDMAQRITKLLEDPELARAMGRKGRIMAEEHFSWEAIGRQTVDLYQTLL